MLKAYSEVEICITNLFDALVLLGLLFYYYISNYAAFKNANVGSDINSAGLSYGRPVGMSRQSDSSMQSYPHINIVKTINDILHGKGVSLETSKPPHWWPWVV